MSQSDKKEKAVDLPHLARIFEVLRRGRHICLADGGLYTDLESDFEGYRILFAQLGFELVRHPRDFFYFRDRDNFSDSAAKMALFMFVLIEDMADRGEDIESGVMSQDFRYSELPHLGSERYRELMREAGISTEAELENLVRTMERFGFTERSREDGFRFRSPIYRFLDICMEMAREHEQAVADADAEGEVKE